MSMPLSYRALQAEMIFSKILLSMAIINVFFNEIGLTQAQIGITQAVFTAVVLPLDVPFGKLADHTNRAVMNAFGDLLAASAFVLYATANSFGTIIVSEAMLAVGIAASSGTDGTLMRGYCDRYGRVFATEKARVQMVGFAAGTLSILLGGVLGNINIRAPFWADVIVFGICIVLALFVRDYSPRLSRSVGMWSLVKHAVHGNKRLSARIMAIAPVRESTHAIVWLATPVLLANSLPLWAVGGGWATMYIMGIPGAYMAQRVATKTAVQRLAVPFVLSLLGMMLCVTPNVLVIFAGLAVLGMASGFSDASIEPILAQASDASIQTTATSIASTARKLLYIPVVIVVNWVASNFGNTAAYATNAVLFTALCGVALWRLHNNE